jgi:DNA helicase-2/ATP-dependent DNA helicase PcrA
VEQSKFVADRVLEHREAGVALKKQAVLFRASHHALALETELASRKIPYVKYGGLKFLEAAHIKDLLSILRLAENPRDVISGLRALQMLPGVGPRNARRLLDNLGPASAPFEPWKKQTVPAEAKKQWKGFLQLLAFLRGVPAPELPAQIHAVREYYAPCVERMYDSSQSRLQDLEQIEAIAARYGTRATMLAEMTLDPPNSTADLAADPLLDEDYLILSTIHSAKGLEWETVFVIHAADGNIPSDMAVKNDDQVEEERRLLYVALTRARNWLYVCYPQRYYQGYGNRSNRHGYAQVSRFLQGAPGRAFSHRTPGTSKIARGHPAGGAEQATKRRSIRSGTLGKKLG